MVHYLKKNFKNFLIGFAIGTAAIIPGISGGTIAILLKIYDKIIFSINHLLKDFKNSFLFLLPIVFGLVVAITSLTIPMTYAFSNFPIPLVSLFAGLIVGGTLSLHKELPKTFTKSNYLIFTLSFTIAALLGLFSVIGKLDGSEVLSGISISSGIILIIVGFLGVSAFIVPGISGSMLMLSIGFYIPILNLIREFMRFNFNLVQLVNLTALGIGALIGLVVISKTMAYLMKNYRTLSFVGIFGFVLGSVISLYVNYEIIGFYADFDLLTLLLSVGAFLVGYFISKRLEEKR